MAIQSRSGTADVWARRAVEGSADKTHFDEAAATIYASLSEHQCGEHWFGRQAVACFHEWAKRFDVEFKLDVPEIALRVDVLPCNRYGHFRMGHNGFGLRGEIALNAVYLQQRPPWQTLGTLLHELLHGWQQAHGTPGKRNHHNREFRDKALSLGLVIDRRGVTNYLENSPFTRLLRGCAVDVPPLDVATPPAPDPPRRGDSRMKKWSCGCINVRCARELSARCLRCGRLFVRAM